MKWVFKQNLTCKWWVSLLVVLQELGLSALTNILRGSVRIEKNPLLCFVDTVNWELIAKAGHHSIEVRIQHVFFTYSWNCNPLQIGMTSVCSSSPKVVYRGVHKLQHTVARGSQTYVIVKICYGLIRTGFRSSFTRRYCEFLSWDLGVTLLIIMGVAVYWVAVVRGDQFSTPPEGYILMSLFTIPISPHTELHVLCTLCHSDWLTFAPLHFPFNVLISSPSFTKTKTSEPTFSGHHHHHPHRHDDDDDDDQWVM
jgi:hypothetical protein